MAYSKSTEFLHLPQYKEMDVLNVLSDFNRAMYNIDVGVSTIQMVVNNVLLQGNLTKDEVEELKTRIEGLSGNNEELENALSELSLKLEQFEASTNTTIENMNTAILNCATEKQLENRFELLMGENQALRNSLDAFESSTNANLETMNAAILNCATEKQLEDRYELLMGENQALRGSLDESDVKIETLQSMIPVFTHTTNVGYVLNSASSNNISNTDIKIETSTYGMYRKHDIYFSFDYETSQQVASNMYLSFNDITPIHELLNDSEFFKTCSVSASGYTSGGNVMPMSAGVRVRTGTLVITFTGSDATLLPDDSESHITVHISGFTMRSDN